MTAPRSPGDLPDARESLTQVGETFTLSVRLSEPEIQTFARQLHDLNPVHHDHAAARAAGYPGLIASGAHTGAIFMGMTATHYAQPLPSGAPRTVLGMGFDIRFRAVVLADEDLLFRWTVTGVEWIDSLGGAVAQLEGSVRAPRGTVLKGTGKLLLRHG